MIASRGGPLPLVGSALLARPSIVTAFDIFVQEGCVPDAQRPAIMAALDAACRRFLGAGTDPLEVRWTVVRKGYGFRGGEPSTTSLVRARIPDGCSPETRAALLKTLGEAWREVTGTGEEEVVVSARDWSWSG